VYTAVMKPRLNLEQVFNRYAAAIDDREAQLEAIAQFRSAIPIENSFRDTLADKVTLGGYAVRAIVASARSVYHQSLLNEPVVSSVRREIRELTHLPEVTPLELPVIEE
jgi:type VI protein secretion system component VasK